MKLSQFNKTNDRFLIMSETYLYKVDPRKGKIMRSEKLSDVAGVTCGSGSHQLTILHMKDKKDLVFTLISPEGEDRVGELVALLANMKGCENLRVKVTEEMHCFMGGKSRTVVVQPDANQNLPNFNKTKSGYIFTYPS